MFLILTIKKISQTHFTRIIIVISWASLKHECSIAKFYRIYMCNCKTLYTLQSICKIENLKTRIKRENSPSILLRWACSTWTPSLCIPNHDPLGRPSSDPTSTTTRSLEALADMSPPMPTFRLQKYFSAHRIHLLLKLAFFQLQD